MKRNITLLTIILATLFLIGCTITHPELRNELAATQPLAQPAPCTFKYSLDLKAYSRFFTLGNKPISNTEVMVDNYLKATQEVFDKRGCTAQQVKNEEEANFRIQIIVSPLVSALPQEWLTGLSFGLIPSWGTKRGEAQYIFENVTLKKSYTYFIDRPIFSHAILFPVFWVSFLWPNEIDLYRKALANFIESS